MRTWAEWDDAWPGFVEIDLVGHEGGNSKGEFCLTLDITDIATGWTETVSVKNKAQKWVFAAIKEATAKFPFPILGIDSDYAEENAKPRNCAGPCQAGNADSLLGLVLATFGRVTFVVSIGPLEGNAMDTTVREIGERVVAALEMAGFTRLTVLEYGKWIRRLDLLARKQGGVYTPGLGAEFASLTTSPRTGKFSDQRRKAHSRLVDLFDPCVLTGRVDLSVRKRGEDRATLRSQEFAALLATWSEEIEECGLASETRTAYGRTAWAYLLYLEANGITS